MAVTFLVKKEDSTSRPSWKAFGMEASFVLFYKL